VIHHNNIDESSSDIAQMEIIMQKPRDLDESLGGGGATEN
jgi:hypothetical protein